MISGQLLISGWGRVYIAHKPPEINIEADCFASPDFCLGSLGFAISLLLQLVGKKRMNKHEASSADSYFPSSALCCAQFYDSLVNLPLVLPFIPVILHSAFDLIFSRFIYGAVKKAAGKSEPS